MAELTPAQKLLNDLNQEVEKNVVTMTPEHLFRVASQYQKLGVSRESRIIQERLYDLLDLIPMSDVHKTMILRKIKGVKRERSPNKNRSNGNRSNGNKRFTSSFPRRPVRISIKFKKNTGMRGLANALPSISMNARGTMRNMWNALANVNKNKNKNRSKRMKN